MPRQDVEDLFAVAFAAAGFDDVAEHDLLAGIVQARIEAEAAAEPRRLNRPAGERARDLGDVLLRVAAVDAERVELHQLAPVVLVQALRRVLLLRGRLVHLGKTAAESRRVRNGSLETRRRVRRHAGPLGSALIQLSR